LRKYPIIVKVKIKGVNGKEKKKRERKEKEKKSKKRKKQMSEENKISNQTSVTIDDSKVVVECTAK
jgi:hypothetical protein